jgi:hypothetical protein
MADRTSKMMNLSSQDTVITYQYGDIYIIFCFVYKFGIS